MLFDDVQTTEAASASGNERTADMYTLLNIARESSAIERSDIEWIVIYKALPGCWWKIQYVIDGQGNDTTTWSASVIGDPIHLVEEN